jgi:hypothetical protein
VDTILTGWDGWLIAGGDGSFFSISQENKLTAKNSKIFRNFQKIIEVKKIESGLWVRASNG